MWVNFKFSVKFNTGETGSFFLELQFGIIHIRIKRDTPVLPSRRKHSQRLVWSGPEPTQSQNYASNQLALSNTSNMDLQNSMDSEPKDKFPEALGTWHTGRVATQTWCPFLGNWNISIFFVDLDNVNNVLKLHHDASLVRIQLCLATQRLEQVRLEAERPNHPSHGGGLPARGVSQPGV